MKRAGKIRGILLCAAAFCLSFATSCTNPPAAQDARTRAEFFVYPIGEGVSVTEARDRIDDWYNAQDFGENLHLGEDWNGNGGGNTDCGLPVRASANGVITYSKNAGIGWGKVVMIDHILPDGSEVQTLYGHLKEISKSDGTVSMGEVIGTIGDGDGRYSCHLHFEMRSRNSSEWGMPGTGYSGSNGGWTDPSDFIDDRLAISLR